MDLDSERHKSRKACGNDNRTHIAPWEVLCDVVSQSLSILIRRFFLVRCLVDIVIAKSYCVFLLRANHCKTFCALFLDSSNPLISRASTAAIWLLGKRNAIISKL